MVGLPITRHLRIFVNILKTTKIFPIKHSQHTDHNTYCVNTCYLRYGFQYLLYSSYPLGSGHDVRLLGDLGYTSYMSVF